jgi:hypothetical protein
MYVQRLEKKIHECQALGSLSIGGTEDFLPVASYILKQLQGILSEEFTLNPHPYRRVENLLELRLG